MKLLHITFYKIKTMLTDKAFFVAMVLIPLFITLSTGYALKHEKLNVVPVALVDEDNSEASNILKDRILKKEGLQVNLTQREKAIELIKEEKIEAAFIIKKDFSENIAHGISSDMIDLISSPSSFSSSYVQELVSGEVMRLGAQSMAVDKITTLYKKHNVSVNSGLINEINIFYQSQWEPKPLVTVDYREVQNNSAQEVKRISLPSSTAASSGIILVFIMFFVLFCSGWVIEERNNGTLKRLISGPGALIHSFAGNVLALMAAGLLQIVLFSVILKLAFDVNIFPGTMSYLLFSAYLLSVISISMLLSSILKTPAQLQAGGPIFALLTGFAGGCFWNFVDPTKQLKQLADLTPQGWALQGINKLLAEPGNAAAALTPLLVLLSISIVLLPLSYLILRKQVRS